MPELKTVLLKVRPTKQRQNYPIAILNLTKMSAEVSTTMN